MDPIVGKLHHVAHRCKDAPESARCYQPSHSGPFVTSLKVEGATMSASSGFDKAGLIRGNRRQPRALPGGSAAVGARDVDAVAGVRIGARRMFQPQRLPLPSELWDWRKHAAGTPTLGQGTGYRAYGFNGGGFSVLQYQCCDDREMTLPIVPLRTSTILGEGCDGFEFVDLDK